MTLNDYLRYSRPVSTKQLHSFSNTFNEFRKDIDIQSHLRIVEIFSSSHEIETICLQNENIVIFDHSLYNFFKLSVRLGKEGIYEHFLEWFTLGYLLQKSFEYDDLELSRGLYGYLMERTSDKENIFYINLVNSSSEDDIFPFNISFIYFTLAHEFAHCHFLCDKEFVESSNQVVEYFISRRRKSGLSYGTLLRKTKVKVHTRSKFGTLSKFEFREMESVFLNSDDFKNEVHCDFIGLTLMYKILNRVLLNPKEISAYIYVFNVFYGDFITYLKMLSMTLKNHITIGNCPMDNKIVYQDLIRTYMRNDLLALIRTIDKKFDIIDNIILHTKYVKKYYKWLENFNNMSLYCLDQLANNEFYEFIKQKQFSEYKIELSYDELINLVGKMYMPTDSMSSFIKN